MAVILPVEKWKRPLVSRSAGARGRMSVEDMPDMKEAKALLENLAAL
jgi:hypothetical protein